MMKILDGRCSIVSLSFIGIIIILLSIIHVPNNVLSWDVFGYYLYLPSFFVYHDLGINNLVWIDTIVQLYNNTDTLYQFSPSPIGHNVIQYPMGLAILYMPFFLLAHGFTFLMDYPSDGFSSPYQVAFIIGNLFYMAIGLLYLRKTLLLFYSDKITALVLLIVAIGTNYMHLNVWNMGMPHNYLFTLYNLLIWVTIKWHKEKTINDSIKLGVLIGLIILIRPSEVVCVLIPLLYGFKSFHERMDMMISNLKNILITVITVIAVGLPQLFYWKIYGGSFFYVSYRNYGEGLDFLSPHILDVLFSFRKGWLIYTPVMAFSIIGIYFLRKRFKKLFMPVLWFFLFNLFIVSSWSVWWYAESFSQRALMQSYAIMAIPLGSFLTWTLSLRNPIKGSILLLILILIGLNFFQIWQSDKGIIDGSRMTKAYYFSVFGQTTPVTDQQKKLLLIQRSTTAEEHFDNTDEYRLAHTITMDFEDDKGNDTANYHSGNKGFKMNSKVMFSPALRSSFKDLTNKDHAWIKVTIWIYPSENWKESKLSLITTFEHGEGKNYKYRGLDTEQLDSIVSGKWNKLELDYLTPEVRSDNDNIVVYAWLRGNQEITVDDIEIRSFTKKE